MFKKYNKHKIQNPASSTNSRGKHKGIKTVLGEGTQFKGALMFEGSVRIDGLMEGEIVTKGTLYIGEKAVIMADISVGSVIVCGKVSGNIVASEKVSLKRPAEIFGNIRAPMISIEEGVIFQGTCDMDREEITFQPVPHLLDNDEHIEDNEEIVHKLVEDNEEVVRKLLEDHEKATSKMLDLGEN